MDWMREAYRLTRKDGAAGIDGVTAAAYEVQLEANLRDLLDRIKSGRYQAPPVRRAYIPKGSCPVAWCSSIDLRLGRGQAATPGRLTRGASLRTARLSRLM